MMSRTTRANRKQLPTWQRRAERRAADPLVQARKVGHEAAERTKQRAAERKAAEQEAAAHAGTNSDAARKISAAR